MQILIWLWPTLLLKQPLALTGVAGSEVPVQQAKEPQNTAGCKTTA
jgi:hypothetical protein